MIMMDFFRKFCYISILCVSLAVSGTLAVENAEHDHSMDHSRHDSPPAKPAVITSPDSMEGVGVTEKLGESLPSDIRFKNENGNSVVLGEIIDKPTLILPIFFHCPYTCSLMLSNLSAALNDVTFKPGSEYRIIALSFDDEETPEHALNAKKNYLPLLKEDFPEKSWRFLTGSAKDVRAFTTGVGFNFIKQDTHTFVHPNVLICISANGKIIRYIYGPKFLPFDISMAISEAEKGTPSISIKKLVSYCFAYDPENKRYVFKTFKITAFTVMILLAVFLFFLTRKRKIKVPKMPKVR